MTTIEWYRVYHGMPEDAKLRVIAKRSGQLMAHVVTVWLCVLDAASRYKPRGTVKVDSEQIAVMQDITQEAVEGNTLFKKEDIQQAASSLVSFQNVAGETFTRALRLSADLAVNREEHADVPAELSKWVWAGGRKLKGLVKRRAAEATVYAFR